MDDTLAKVIASKGIRPSAQRVLIYKYLLNNTSHPTVDKIFSDLSPDFPSLSKTTVYNTLKLFASKKLVRIVNIEDDELRYDFQMMPHAHFKCTSCGKIYDVFVGDALGDFSRACAAQIPDGFSCADIQANVWGTCAACEGKASS